LDRSGNRTFEDRCMTYQPNAATKWILRPRPNAAARFRLFCFPYAGGGSSAYRTWAAELPADVELCLVQMPGRESRWKDTPFLDMTDLVATAHDALREHLDRPYAFFGHSLGGLVSFELARALRASGAPGPAHLFVSAHRAPQLPNPHPEMRHLENGAFVDEIKRRYGGIPQAVLDTPDLLQLVLPCLRADFTVFETYQYVDGPRLDIPISAFGGTADDYVMPDALAGWESQTSQPFSLRLLPGDHFYLQNERAAVLTSIAAALTATAATGTFR
jgi:medium-chain acyl-[acyl-carrier-protein] hydrolase